jgi:hypothetical protein
MGIDVTFGKAYAKAAIAAGQRLPQSGNVFITMMDKYKEAAVPIAKDLQALGFGIMATYNTAAHLRAAGLKDVQSVLKVQEGRPNAGAHWAVGWAVVQAGLGLRECCLCLACASLAHSVSCLCPAHLACTAPVLTHCLLAFLLSSCFLPAPSLPGLQRT